MPKPTPVYDILDVKLCPLRHAIVPGPPSLAPGQGTLEFRDVPCLQHTCAWWDGAYHTCVITDIACTLKRIAQHGPE